ncbi:MAG: Vitamin B12 dependent methionine synthase activation subunit, partial [Clostridia bacterium]|nr:Vitamin B12 dependent methionine synthase activation subunit [Clostridia bacterium]
CSEVVVFAATVGIEIDRLIKKYNSVSPSRALVLSAVGTEAIESLADAFSADISKEYNIRLRPRFSAGYGDLPLEAQREIFKILDAPRNIGLSLTDGLIMSPTKSVTAFIGLDRK